MTGIEQRLSEILLAEADRHEVPVFDAHGIAESAGRKGFWGRRRVVLLAAIGLVGATGGTGAVFAAGGHEHHDRVTVTFRPFAGEGKPDSAEALQNWVRGRVRAEGLDDVDITVRPSPLTLVVTGRAADAARLRMLGHDGHLWIGQMSQDHSRLPRRYPGECFATQPIGPPVQVCDEQGTVYSFTSVNGPDIGFGVASAHAEHRKPGVDGWAIVVQLDAGGTRQYASFTGAVAPSEGRIEPTIDGSVVLDQPTLAGPVENGVIASAAAFTEQQAKDLALDLVTPGSWDFDPDQTTVDFEPRGTG
jgi:hypothetical protein